MDREHEQDSRGHRLVRPQRSPPRTAAFFRRKAFRTVTISRAWACTGSSDVRGTMDTDLGAKANRRRSRAVYPSFLHPSSLLMFFVATTIYCCPVFTMATTDVASIASLSLSPSDLRPDSGPSGLTETNVLRGRLRARKALAALEERVLQVEGGREVRDGGEEAVQIEMYNNRKGGPDNPRLGANRRVEEDDVGISVERSSLPQCYTTPGADPSKGAWRRTDGGIHDSPVTLDRAEWPAYKDDIFGHLSSCYNTWTREHAEDGPMPYYVWDAEECFLDTVDAGKFCAAMSGRKGLLFVGDSLSRHMTTALASILRASSTIGGADHKCHDEWSACDGALPLRFQRNDFLDPSTERIYDNNTQVFDQYHCQRPDHSNTRCTVFADDEILGGFDTLVVNSGAHVRPPEEFGPAIEAASEAITRSMRRLHGEDVILVVRNTATGHWECNERMFEGPVDGDEAQRLVAAAPEEYKYPSFQESNRLLEQAFVSNRSQSLFSNSSSSLESDYGEDGWVLLDAYSPSLFRADMHLGGKGPDCLHYCIYGPYDHWVRLLYNIILAAKSEGKA